MLEKETYLMLPRINSAQQDLYIWEMLLLVLFRWGKLPYTHNNSQQWNIGTHHFTFTSPRPQVPTLCKTRVTGARMSMWGSCLVLGNRFPFGIVVSSGHNGLRKKLTQHSSVWDQWWNVEWGSLGFEVLPTRMLVPGDVSKMRISS